MIIREIDKRHAEVKLYGNIGDWFSSGDTFTSVLEDLEVRGFKHLTVRMHCYGGSVLEGNVLFNSLLRTTLKVKIIIDGLAASMGCFLLPSCEDVEIADNGFGMVHRPISFADGDADDHLETAKLLRDMEGNFIKRLAERTGKSAEQIKTQWFDGKDHWLNAQEMVDCGLAHRVVPATAKDIKQLDVEAVAGMSVENIYTRYAACLEIKPPSTKTITMKKTIIESFQLEGVTAESSDAAVLQALQNKVKAAENRLEAFEKAQAESVKAMLDDYQAKNLITAKTRPAYEAIGEKAGIEALGTALSGLNVRKPLASYVAPEGKEAGAADSAKNWGWYQKNDPKALERMQDENPEDFRELYKAEYGCYPV